MFHNTKRTKYNAKIQMKQNINMTEYKNSKIQTGQNTKEQNKNCQNKILTKYKCNKMQIEQNTNRTKCKTSKVQQPYSRSPPLIN